MATLAEQRAAIRQGITNARAATGAAERQAIHDNMVARRTGEAIKDNLNALETPRRRSGELRRTGAKGGIAATTSPGTPATQPTGQTSGGIASPLIEKVGEGGADTRTYFDERTLPTTDGLLVFRVRRTETITMIDANGAEVVLEFSNVPGT